VKTDSSTTIPNNLGATLLIASGITTIPVGVGIYLILIGVATLRDSGGEISYPKLRGLLLIDQIVQFCRIIKV
jgi:hypothetical protein